MKNKKKKFYLGMIDGVGLGTSMSGTRSKLFLLILLALISIECIVPVVDRIFEQYLVL
jgi:hypothetical protein